MEKFVSIFRAGGKTNSLGRAQEVQDTVLTDPSRIDELYDCIFADDAWVRMRAADCLEKICRLHPEWVEPYVDRMLDDLSDSTQPSIQWHLAQIFAEVHLSDAQRKRAIAWMKDLLSSRDVDWIVSANTMKTLIQFHSSGWVSKTELEPLLELQTQHKSSAVQKKAKIFTDLLHSRSHTG